MKSPKSDYRKLCIFMIIFFFITTHFLASCGGGGGGDNGSSPEGETGEYIVYTNPTDGRFSSKIESDGTVVTYYGTKDVNGSPLSLNLITVKDPSIDGEFIYEINDNDTLGRIYTPDGVVFEIEQISDTSLRLKTISKSGDIQLSNLIFQESNNSSKMMYNQPKATTTNNIAASQATESFTFNLTRCGQPVEDAVIQMEINPPLGDYLLYAEKIGGGKFLITTPAFVDMQSVEEGIKTCEEVGKKIDKFMDGFEWKVGIKPILSTIKTCEQLNKTLNRFKSTIPSEYRSAISDICNPALIKNIKLISSVPKYGATFTDICTEGIIMHNLEALTKDYEYTYNLIIQLAGKAPYYSESADFDPNSPPRDLTVLMPPEISCEKIYTVPASPKATEGYQAKASCVCPDPDYGTEVAISWENPTSGDNGETKTETIYKDQEVIIPVPPVSAADSTQGVTDIITVEAEGESWTYPESQNFKYLSAATEQTKKWVYIVQRESEEDLPTSDYTDYDGDGYYSIGSGGDDCDDDDASINPGATEIPNDGIDQDCDGQDETAEISQLYVLKLSGVGYHKTYGQAAKVTGYEYQALWLLPSELAEILGTDFDNTTACERGPWAGPVLAPAIWESRSMVKVAGPLDSYDDLEAYRCPVPNWVYSNPICNQWAFEYDYAFYDDIDGLCGN